MLSNELLQVSFQTNVRFFFKRSVNEADKRKVLTEFPVITCHTKKKTTKNKTKKKKPH